MASINLKQYQKTQGPLWDAYTPLFLGMYAFSIVCLILLFFALLLNANALAGFLGWVGIIVAASALVAGILFSLK